MKDFKVKKDIMTTARDIPLTLEGVLANGLYCPDCVEYDEETDSYKPKDKIRNEQIGHTESLAEKERGKVQE